MTKKKPVAHSRERSEKSKETTTEHHPFAIFDVVRQSHGDQGDPSDQVADVEEEKAAKERIGCPQDLHRLLASPQGPQGRAEVPDGLHDDAVSSSNNLLPVSFVAHSFDLLMSLKWRPTLFTTDSL